VNVLSARLERIEGARATVALGAARMTVPSALLKEIMPGAMVELFLRPEDLRLAREGDAIAALGTVAAHIYQGGHIDLYVHAAEAVPGRVLLRLPAHVATSPPAAGTRIGIALATAEAVAFPQPARG
jgi:putative spermidine/putrescine transport system ATP-binding protein/spermidine/putrescine transport system ATP-binding protein